MDNVHLDDKSKSIRLDLRIFPGYVNEVWVNMLRIVSLRVFK